MAASIEGNKFFQQVTEPSFLLGEAQTLLWQGPSGDRVIQCFSAFSDAFVPFLGIGRQVGESLRGDLGLKAVTLF